MSQSCRPPRGNRGWRSSARPSMAGIGSPCLCTWDWPPRVGSRKGWPTWSTPHRCSSRWSRPSCPWPTWAGPGTGSRRDGCTYRCWGTPRRSTSSRSTRLLRGPLHDLLPSLVVHDCKLLEDVRRPFHDHVPPRRSTPPSSSSSSRVPVGSSFTNWIFRTTSTLAPFFLNPSMIPLRRVVVYF